MKKTNPDENAKNRDWIAPDRMPGVAPEDYPAVRAPDETKPVDAPVEERFGSMQNAYVAGFSSAHGVRNATFESLGTDRYPDTRDHALREPTPRSIDKENPGLADG